VQPLVFFSDPWLTAVLCHCCHLLGFSLQLYKLARSIDRGMPRVCEYRAIVPHLDEAHFNQSPKIIRADGRQFHPLAFNIAQRPAKMDRRS
jgi:hypothetical protein